MNLQYYSDFKKELANYRVSDSAREIINDLKLVLLIAPSSGGRNTVIKHQVASGKYYYIVSDTTRSPRVNDGVLETNGKEYWFRTEKEMLDDIRAGSFLEAELIHEQQVSGISIRELKKAKDNHEIAITDVDLDGIHKVLAVKPDTIAIMLVPPSFAEWQKRMRGRGEMSEAERVRRLKTAEMVFEDGLKQDYYHFVITENIEHSGQTIDGIVNSEPSPYQEKARELISELQAELRRALKRVR
jgi:guanylate kinase